MRGRLIRRYRIAVAAVMAAVVFVVSSIASSCNNTGCTENQSALPLMGFYASSTLGAMALDSIDIGGVGAPGDSLLVCSGTRTQSVYLPFRVDCRSTSFFFHYDYPMQGLDDPAFNDTITFCYTSTPYFASEECGAMYVYHIDSIEFTRHLIENVVVVDSMITNVDLERIQVFFRVEEVDPDSGSADVGEQTDPDNEGEQGGTDEKTDE